MKSIRAYISVLCFPSMLFSCAEGLKKHSDVNTLVEGSEFNSNRMIAPIAINRAGAKKPYKYIALLSCINAQEYRSLKTLLLNSTQRNISNRMGGIGCDILTNTGASRSTVVGFDRTARLNVTRCLAETQNFDSSSEVANKNLIHKQLWEMDRYKGSPDFFTNYIDNRFWNNVSNVEKNKRDFNDFKEQLKVCLSLTRSIDRFSVSVNNRSSYFMTGMD